MTTQEIHQNNRRSARYSLQGAFLAAAEASGKRIRPEKKYIKSKAKFVTVGKRIVQRHVV